MQVSLWQRLRTRRSRRRRVKSASFRPGFQPSHLRARETQTQHTWIEMTTIHGQTHNAHHTGAHGSHTYSYGPHQAQEYTSGVPNSSSSMRRKLRGTTITSPDLVTLPAGFRALAGATCELAKRTTGCSMLFSPAGSGFALMHAPIVPFVCRLYYVQKGVLHTMYVKPHVYSAVKLQCTA